MNEKRETRTQGERFEQAARELGVDLDEDKLKEALRKMRYHDTPTTNDEHPDKDGS